MLPDELKSEEEKMADLPAGVTMDPETEELMKDGEPWEPEPTPEMILMQKQQEIDEAGHQAELAKSEATMATADADKKQAEAKVATAEAAMAKAQAEMQTLQGGQENGDMMADIQGIIQQTMEEHELNESAHKEATEEMIANAVVDALKRVRGFVDRKVKSDLGELATSTKEEGPASASTTSQANGGAAPAPAAAVILNVEPKPDRIDFKYDGDGQIVSAEPIYTDQRQEEQGEREEE
jgi:hypothetical protein